MTEALVDLVARAIAGCEDSRDFAELSLHWQEQFRKEAKAAIAVVQNWNPSPIGPGLDAAITEELAREPEPIMVEDEG